MIHRYTYLIFIAFNIFFSVTLNSCVDKKKKSTPVAINGVLDLSTWDFSQDGPVLLQGEWRIEWLEFIEPRQLNKKPKIGASIIKVPGLWDNQDISKKHEFNNQTPYATYILEIKISPEQKNLEQDIGLKVDEAWSATNTKVINQLGREIISTVKHGNPSKTSADEIPMFLSTITPIDIGDTRKIVILIQISNHNTPRFGIHKAPQIGITDKLQTDHFRAILPSLILLGALMMIGIYHVVLYIQKPEDKTSAIFAFLCLTVALREITTSRILQHMGLVNSLNEFNIFYNLQLCSIPLAVISIGLFIKIMVPSKTFSYLFKTWFLGFGIIIIILTLMAEKKSVSFKTTLGEGYILVAVLLALAYLVYKSLKKDRIAQWLSLSLVTILCGAVNDVLHSKGIITTGYYAAYTVIGFVLLQSTIVSAKAAKAYKKAEELSIYLKKEVQLQTNALESKTTLAVSAKKESDKSRQEALDAKREYDLAHQEAEALRQKAERQAARLKEIDREKTSFFQNISHELRTPLTLILNPLEHASMQYSDDKNIQIAKKNSRRLLRLVNQLLDFQKLAAGKKKIKLIPIDITNFCLICGEYFLQACMNKDISFSIKYENKNIDQKTPAIWVMAEVDALEKIVFNFLSNAIKYTPKYGSIELILETRDNLIKLIVLDNGPGISAKDQEKLFRVFSQADQSTTRKYEGTGLGLALVKSLSEEIHGKVGVDSVLGEGCSFWMELEMLPPQKPQIRLLIVEENEALRETIVHRIANSMGLSRSDICTKSTAEEALSFISHYDASCIICDYQLGEKNGLDLMTEVTKNSPNTYRILITAQADFELLERAINEKLVHQVFHKTEEDDDFIDKIEEVVIKYTSDSTSDYPVRNTIDLLIVEDDLHLLMTMRELVIEEINIKSEMVETTTSVDEALQYLSKNNVRCVLSDYNLGQTNGLNLLEEITREYPETKRVLMTAQADLDIMQRAVNQGSVDKIFYKPFKMEELITTIQLLIKESNLNPEKTNDQIDFRPWLLAEIDESEKEDSQTDIDNIDENRAKELILIVDDLADMRTVISQYLRQKDYQILTASNGQEGLEIARKFIPDLIITDWMMPEMSGTEMIQKLNEDPRLSSIPNLLLTAKSDEESRILGTEIGADAYLGKPFNEKELISIVRNLLSLKLNERTVDALNKKLTENVLKRFLPPTIVDQIVCGESKIEEKPRLVTATILFSDLVGFTNISNDIRVTKASKILNQYFEIMNEVIFSHGGTIDKFIGDSIMVIFGAPTDCEPPEQAKKATECALAMQIAMNKLNEEWSQNKIPCIQMRIGIHQGPVMVGTFGSTRRYDYTAIGPTVDKASLIEGHCEPGHVYVSAEVCDFLDDAITKKVGSYDLEGLDGEHNLYKLAG